MANMPDQSKEAKQTSPFSTSVNHMLNVLGKEEATILKIFQVMMSIHPEYAIIADESKISREISRPSKINSLIDFLKSENIYLIRRLPSEWIEIVTGIFNKPEDDVIHGRLFCIAVILNEYETIAGLPAIREEEWRNQASMVITLLLQELESGKSQKIKSLLTPYGLNLWAELFGPTGQHLHETVNVTDLPSKTDLLSRRSLAKYLSNRLRYIYDPQGRKNQKDTETDQDHHINNRRVKAGSFFMHIDGAWGSGKSTLLGFLKEELEVEHDKLPWIIVEFNAWQHQRLNPPWWFLMKAVHEQAMKKLWAKKRIGKWIKMRVNELFWRINTGTNYGFAAIATLALFLVAPYIEFTSKLQWNGLPVVQAGSAVAFFWTLTGFLRTGLVPGSSRAALKFIEEHGSDPMQVLSDHFEKHCHALDNQLAIFIDDLDRCNKEYGIQLIEGLQTIFKNAPVVYIIACDRKWLVTMYENQFQDFSGIIGKPGKPFGMVFLDKVFQLTVELPSISNVHKSNYWNYLLNLHTGKGDLRSREEMREEVNAELDKKTNNSSRLKVLREKDQGVLAQVKREEILANISIGEEEKYIESRLQKFLPLVEPNPRAMKRIINDVSTIKAITFLYNQDVDDDQLILWAILKIQWPALADHFWEHPGQLSAILIDDANPVTGKPDLDGLLKQTEIRNIFSYMIDGKVVRLDERFMEVMKFDVIG